MAQDKHIQHLNEFRAAIVEERRRLAKAALSAKKGKTVRKDFVEMQETIDAIDRALADERDVESKSKSPV
jgi:acyl-CoA reductase-like NAD-dependent aldehyde dehydrogenase